MQIVVTWWSRTRKWNTYSKCHQKNGVPINKQSNVPWRDDRSSRRTLSVILTKQTINCSLRKIYNYIDFKTAFNIVSGKCTLQSLFFFIFCVHCRSDIHFNYVRTEALFHSSRSYHLPYYFDIQCCANPYSGNIFRVFVLWRRMVHHLQKEKCKKIWYYCSMGIKQI